jgi:hypothetical protein
MDFESDLVVSNTGQVQVPWRTGDAVDLLISALVSGPLRRRGWPTPLGFMDQRGRRR